MKRIAAASLLLISSTALGAEEDYRIVDVSGQVAVIPKNGSEGSPASVGLPLSAGDRVVTGSGGQVELAAKSGTVIRLEGNSSLGLDDLRSGWTQLRLYVGRLLARFERGTKTRYNIKTPVAVASVRGTELALEVGEDGSLEAGVIEGEVAIEPPAEKPAEGEQAGWDPEILTSSQGVSVAPLGRPRRLSEIPRPLVRSLDWFPRVRQRVPALRERWKDLDPPSRQRLRNQALRERIKWEVPPRLRQGLKSPRERVKPHRRSPRPGRPQSQ